MKKYIILVLVILAFAINSCNDSSSKLKLIISCNPGSTNNDGSFSGLYMADGGSPISFTGAPMGSTSPVIYIYEQIFENVDTLIVNVTKAYGDASLDVYIYEDEDLVLSKSLSGNYPDSNNPTNTLSATYQAGSTTDTSSE